MKREVLNVRYASLERLRLSWYRRMSKGQVYVPYTSPLAPGTLVSLQIIVQDAPAPLELEGRVASLHAVDVDGQKLQGAEVDLYLPTYIRSAVEAFLAADWRRAAPVLGDSSKLNALWMPFGPSTGANRVPPAETRPNPPVLPPPPPEPPSSDPPVDGARTSTEWFRAQRDEIPPPPTTASFTHTHREETLRVANPGKVLARPEDLFEDGIPSSSGNVHVPQPGPRREPEPIAPPVEPSPDLFPQAFIFRKTR